MAGPRVENHLLVRQDNSGESGEVADSSSAADPHIRELQLERDGIVEGRLRQGERGFLAECQLQINERVEGFREGGERKLYRDLRQSRPGMTPKTRDFRTTGVVMRIDEDWFRRPRVKQEGAESLRDLVLREYSISPQDVDVTATNISMILMILIQTGCLADELDSQHFDEDAL